MEFDPVGASSKNFETVAKIYAPIIAGMDLSEDEWVLCQFSEDETPVRVEPQFDGDWQHILGCCGKLGKEHKCDENHRSLCVQSLQTAQCRVSLS